MLWAYCQSGNVNEINGNYYCMPGSVSITGPTVPRNLSEGDLCYYRYYNNTNNFNMNAMLTYQPSCGYNMDGSAYCDAKTGDRSVQSILNMYKKVFNSKARCPNENNFDQLPSIYCADAVSRVDSDFIKK